jgi:hypothetical protein
LLNIETFLISSQGGDLTLAADGSLNAVHGRSALNGLVDGQAKTTGIV